jgi:hypothetical protein
VIIAIEKYMSKNTKLRKKNIFVKIVIKELSLTLINKKDGKIKSSS